MACEPSAGYYVSTGHEDDQDRSLRAGLAETFEHSPSPPLTLAGISMKAYIMTWVHQDTGALRRTMDCGQNKQHAQAGSRALLGGYFLVDERYLGDCTDSNHMIARWGRLWGTLKDVSSDDTDRAVYGD